jgi:hypothetical protein
MKGQKEYQQQVKNLERENNSLLKQIEFLLTKGTSEFLSNTRALIEKNKQEMIKAKEENINTKNPLIKLLIEYVIKNLI